MRLSGFQNFPGAPGNNLFAGGNFLGGAGLAIPGANPTGQPILPGENKKDIEDVYGPGTPTQPQLPSLPGLPSAGLFGGSAFQIAQAYPGGQQIGNTAGASSLGGPLQMNQNYGPRPFNLDINAVDNRLESIGGSTNINLGQNQNLRFGGQYTPAYTDEMGMPIPQGYSIYGQYDSPKFGINASYRNTGRIPGVRSGGLPGEVQAGFKGRF